MTDDRSSPQRQLRLWDAVAIYVGIILGSGIFFAPSGVARAAPGLGGALGLWAIGGAIAACGALVYAECGARLPHNGGFYVFYREAYGPALAFVGGWAALLITYPASIAAIALYFAAYFAQLIDAPASWQVPLAIAAVGAAGLLNGAGVRAGAASQRLLTSAKVGAIALVCVAALAMGDDAAPVLPSAGDPAPWQAAFVLTALVGVLWTYSGWSDVTLVTGELQRPAQNLGRTVLIGTLTLVILYGLVQAAVLHLLGGVRAASSDAVFADAVAHAFGGSASRVVALLVSVSTFGAINGTVLAASRLGYAMGTDGTIPRWFGVMHPRLQIPARSLAGLVAATVAYLMVSDFQRLLGLFTFAVWIFYAVAAVALLRLRRRGIGEPLSWRAPGGPVAPAVLILTAIGMTTSLLWEPEQRRLAMIGLGLLAAGFPTYWIWARARR